MEIFVKVVSFSTQKLYYCNAPFLDCVLHYFASQKNVHFHKKKKKKEEVDLIGLEVVQGINHVERLASETKSETCLMLPLLTSHCWNFCCTASDFCRGGSRDSSFSADALLLLPFVVVDDDDDDDDDDEADATRRISQISFTILIFRSGRWVFALWKRQARLLTYDACGGTPKVVL